MLKPNGTMLALFIYWVKERENIRLLRNIGKPAPWTEDPILQNHHFCNISREDDRGTKEIRQVAFDLCVPLAELPEFYTAARLFNKADTVNDYWSKGIDYIKQQRDKGAKIFHVAYVVSTCGVRMDKIDYVDRVVTDVANSLVSATRCREAFENLRAIDGLGSFLAGQIVADLKNDRYLTDAPDWWDFAVMGPGSKKGLDFIYGPGTTERNFTERLEHLRGTVWTKIPLLHAQDLQNCLCEFSKYVRYYENLPGRRRSYP